MIQPLSIVIGVTGHRDLVAQDEERIERQFRELITGLVRQYPDLYLRVLTGLAEGADQLIAKAALAMRKEGLPVQPVAVYPMPLMQYREDFQGAALVAFEALHSEFMDLQLPVLELPPVSERQQAYVNLGDYLLNKSDMLVAIWDGNLSANHGVPPKPGGTEHITLQALEPLGLLARTGGSPGQLHNNICNYLHDANTLPVYRISANRRSASAVDEHCGYITSVSAEGIKFNDQPDRPAPCTIEHLRELNRCSRALAANSHSEGYGPCDNHEQYSQDCADLASIAEQFKRFDSLANAMQRTTSQTHRAVAGLTLLLTTVFLFYAKILPLPEILAGYVCLFVMSLAWYLWVKPNQIKFRYAFFRAASESLRIEFFWQALGLVDPQGNASLAQRLPSRGLDKSRTIASLIKQSSLGGNKVGTQTIKRSKVLQDWIAGQRKYYNKARQRLHDKHKKIEHWVQITIWIPIFLCLLLLCFYSFFKHTTVPVGEVAWKDVIVFFIGWIPVFGAVLELHANNISIKELQAQYGATEDYLTRVGALLANSQTEDISPAVFEVVGVELSREHMQWLTTTERKAIVPAHGG
jgi:membrane protein YdbS with pleckstrin-like domain